VEEAETPQAAAQEPLTVGSGRILGVFGVVLGGAIVAANFGLAYLLGIYFPIIMIPAGPLITLGLGSIAHPGFAVSWLDSEATDMNPWGGHVVMRVVGAILAAAGVLLGILLFAAMEA
jgi:hypothetical protein